MIAVIFDKYVIDVLSNCLGATALQAERPLQNPKKMSEAISLKPLTREVWGCHQRPRGTREPYTQVLGKIEISRV